MSHSSISNVIKESDWVFDSGASHHFCNDKNLFSKFKLLNYEMSVSVKDVSFPFKGKGEVKLSFVERVFNHCNVMYSDQLRRNLISEPQLDLNGLTFHGNQVKVKIRWENEYLFSVFLKDRIYRLYSKIPSSGNKCVNVKLYLLRKMKE